MKARLLSAINSLSANPNHTYLQRYFLERDKSKENGYFVFHIKGSYVTVIPPAFVNAVARTSVNSTFSGVALTSK